MPQSLAAFIIHGSFRLSTVKISFDPNASPAFMGQGCFCIVFMRDEVQTALLASPPRLVYNMTNHSAPILSPPRLQIAALPLHSQRDCPKVLTNFSAIRCAKTGGMDGVRPSKLKAKAADPRSPAAFFAAQGQSVQKSAKSEPGIKHRSASADVGSSLEHHLLGPGSPKSLDDMATSGHGVRVKPCSPAPASPKKPGTSGLKIQSRTPSGRETPTTGRSQVDTVS